MALPQRLNRPTGELISFRKQAGVIVSPTVRQESFRQMRSNNTPAPKSEPVAKKTREPKKMLPALISLEKDSGFFGHMDSSKIKRSPVIKGGING